MNDTERIERLEKLYEKLYHEVELFEIHAARLADVWIKYFPQLSKEISGDIFKFRGLLEIHETDLQGLKQAYHTHSNKKTKYRTYQD